MGSAARAGGLRRASDRAGLPARARAPRRAAPACRGPPRPRRLRPTPVGQVRRARRCRPCSSGKGPAVASSIKTDLLDATLARRRSLGPVFVFDPFALSGTPSQTWSPLRGAATWDGAVEVAWRLTSAGELDQRHVEGGDFWAVAAEQRLAPLLYAAAAGGVGMGTASCAGPTGFDARAASRRSRFSPTVPWTAPISPTPAPRTTRRAPSTTRLTGPAPRSRAPSRRSCGRTGSRASPGPPRRARSRRRLCSTSARRCTWSETQRPRNCYGRSSWRSCRRSSTARTSAPPATGVDSSFRSCSASMRQAMWRRSQPRRDRLDSSQPQHPARLHLPRPRAGAQPLRSSGRDGDQQPPGAHAPPRRRRPRDSPVLLGPGRRGGGTRRDADRRRRRTHALRSSPPPPASPHRNRCASFPTARPSSSTAVSRRSSCGCACGSRIGVRGWGGATGRASR